MAVQTDFYGQSYVFGFVDADAPTITGFSARRADLSYEPEVRVEATNGEGHVEAVALSKAAFRKITGSFTGYITSAFNPSAVGSAFTFKSRVYILSRVSEPRNKGEYVEVTIEATSNSLITSATPV